MDRTYLLSSVVLFAVSGCSETTASDPAATSEAQLTECTAAEKTARWNAMVKAPIVPLESVGGLDIAEPMKLDQVEAALCAGTSLGSAGAGWFYAGWGNNEELVVAQGAYGQSVDFVRINEGYEGEVTFSSRPGSRFGPHTYSLGVGRPILRDSAPYDIDWSDGRESARELYDALMFTFAPTQPADDVDCTGPGDCTFYVQGDVGIFGVGALRFYLQVFDTTSAKARSTPDHIFMFLKH